MSQNVVLSSVIPEFDPLVDSVDMWINVVEANSRAFGWSDNMIKYQAGSSKITQYGKNVARFFPKKRNQVDLVEVERMA